MIEAAVFDGSGTTTTIAPAAISDVVGRPGTVVWVDVIAPTSDDFLCLQEEFDLHDLAIEDAIKHGQRPKIERYPSHAFVVAYGGELTEVDVFFGPGWLVTVRATRNGSSPWDATVARQRFVRGGREDVTSGFLLYTILDTIVDEHFGRVEAFEARIEDLEEMIFAEPAHPERDVQNELYALRRELLAYRRRVQPLRDVVTVLLRREIEWVDDRARTYLQDVFDHVLRVIDQLDAQRELLGNAVDAHLALISNRMNQVMKKMTSWGALLLGSTLIAGIYGMNFEHMPELGWRLGYPFALGLMLTVTVTGWLYFRRKDWL